MFTTAMPISPPGTRTTSSRQADNGYVFNSEQGQLKTTAPGLLPYLE